MISQSKQKGFTIVELLIVIVVIGILAAISIVAYNNVTQKARDDGRLSDARNIVNAAASFHAEEGTWPSVAELKAYDTVKLSGNAAGDTFGSAAPSSEAKDNLQYIACGSPQTGVQIDYYKEADPAGVQSVTAGTGC